MSAVDVEVISATECAPHEHTHTALAPTLDKELSHVSIVKGEGSLLDVATTRDNVDGSFGNEAISMQPSKIVGFVPAGPCSDTLSRDNLRETQEAQMSDGGHKMRVNGPIFAICPRILTRSERNLARLRIWLGCHAYKTFASVGVCRFGPRSVVKFTAVTRAAEAANIEYIAQNTTIPVPRIQDVFIIGDRTYIVMDYINGTEMTYVSATLSPQQKQGIRLQMKDYLTQMRALKPPNPGRVEAVDGSGIFDIRLPGSPFPSFPSVKEFHACLGHEFVLHSQDHRHVWSQFQAVAQRQYRTTFSHGDLAPRNIIIKKGRIAAIVDWESAGWYPEYWEYARWADSNFRSNEMWYDLRDEILDPYPAELKVDEYVGGVFTRL